MISAMTADPVPGPLAATGAARFQPETKGEKTQLAPDKAVTEVKAVPPMAVQEMIRSLSQAQEEARDAAARADTARDEAARADAARDEAKTEDAEDAAQDRDAKAAAQDQDAARASDAKDTQKIEAAPDDTRAARADAQDPAAAGADRASAESLQPSREAQDAPALTRDVAALRAQEGTLPSRLDKAA
ncbi:MAG: hypothetical protein AAF281_03445 [Pseudomonadota bacterium]